MARRTSPRSSTRGEALARRSSTPLVQNRAPNASTEPHPDRRGDDPLSPHPLWWTRGFKLLSEPPRLGGDSAGWLLHNPVCVAKTRIRATDGRCNGDLAGRSPGHGGRGAGWLSIRSRAGGAERCRLWARCQPALGVVLCVQQGGQSLVGRSALLTAGWAASPSPLSPERCSERPMRPAARAYQARSVEAGPRDSESLHASLSRSASAARLRGSGGTPTTGPI
jgi:hypothetical protein